MSEPAEAFQLWPVFARTHLHRRRRLRLEHFRRSLPACCRGEDAFFHDDELALLLADGSNRVGNVSVVSHGQAPRPVASVDFSGPVRIPQACGKRGQVLHHRRRLKTPHRSRATPGNWKTTSFALPLSASDAAERGTRFAAELAAVPEEWNGQRTARADNARDTSPTYWLHWTSPRVASPPPQILPIHW